MAGTLYVVATPIGNLEDLTFRALRILKEVDLVAAEDTRRTLGLLTHYGITKPLVSVREHNERRESSRLIARLLAGESIALVSDAGTPGIADPGATVVAAARAAGVPVVPVPGPSSLTAALSASGLEFDRVLFLGFPPASGTIRKQWIHAAMDEAGAVLFLEAPHRIRRTLSELAAVSGDRQIIIAREISKRFEDFVEGPISTIAECGLREEGEFTCVIAPENEESAFVCDESRAASVAEQIFRHIAKDSSIEEAAAMRAASAGSGFPMHRMRNLIKRMRFAGRESD